MDPSKPYVATPGAPPGHEYGGPPPPAYVPPTAGYSGAPPPAVGGDMKPVNIGAPVGPPPQMQMQQPGMAPMYVQQPGMAPMYVQQPGMAPVYVQQPGVQPGAYPGAPAGQPNMVAYAQQTGVVLAPGKFSTGLCDCCEGPDAPIGCVISWLIPCWVQGIIGHEVADGVGRVPPFALTCGLSSLAFISNCFWGVCYPYTALIEIPAAIGFIVLSVLGRGKMRRKYGIEGSGLPDCCTVCWCHPCSLAQEIRHIRDTMPGRRFELLENREATRTDLDFFKRATAPFC